MRLWSVLVLAALVVATSTTGCSGCSIVNDKSPYFGTTDRIGKDARTFYVNAGGEPEYIDPGMMHDTASEALVNSLFEGLAAYGPDAEPRPAVAEKWDATPDNRLFRFHLRADAKWSDGKPVTAHDFEYAWRRVLTPSVGSQAASNLYTLLNAEAFNIGKLKSTSKATPLLKTAEAGATEAGSLDPHTAVDVLIASPMNVSTDVAPWTDAPQAKVITFDKADAKNPEKMRVDGEVRGTGGNGAWKGKDVRIVERLGPVTCNDEADHFYRVASGDQSGVFPGCVLAGSKAKGTKFVLVAKHTLLPTFKPSEPQPDTDPTPIGFVDDSALESDPSVLGVRATDDRTLEVELKDPAPYFIDLACHGTLYPVRKDVVEAWEQKGKPDLWTRPENIVSNGAYALDSWKFRYEIRMKKNPYYYDADRLKIDKIVWLEIEEPSQTMNLYQAGEMDYIGDAAGLPPDYLKYLETKKDFHRTDYLATYWYELNTKTPPTDNVLVRRALNLAIDKQQLVDKVVLGHQKPASHYVPDFTGLGYEDYVKAATERGDDTFASPDRSFNPEKARALLQEAGYKVVKDGDGYRADGFPPLEILYNTSEGHKKIAVAIQDEWKRNLGISVTLRNEEWKVMLKNVRDRNFQVVRFGWVADFDHPHTFLDTFLSYSPNNRTGWASPEFDGLVKKAAATADTKESIKLYRQAEELAVAAMAKLPLYFYTRQTLMKPYVKGFHPNARNIQLIKYMWIDPNWKTNDSNDPAYPLSEFPAPGAY
jgi:oligopeptide transport system substrate-binding protein